MWLFFLYILLSVSASNSIPAFNNDTLVSKRVNARISNGDTVDDISQFPHVVQYQVEGGQFCGGVIYNENYILTAAHCVVDATEDMINLKAGSNIRGEGMEIQISEVIVHPNYAEGRLEYDIALLATMDPIDFDENIQPVKGIIEPNRQIFGTVILAGWGKSTPKGDLSDELQKGVVNVISNRQCVRFYSDRVTDEIFCTEQLDPGEGPCTGDDGGPAEKRGSRILVGIINFGGPCSDTRFPSTYANLSAPAINNFITETAGEQYLHLFSKSPLD